MDWEDAVEYALDEHENTGRRMYVRGYRRRDGRWRYGAYREDRPALASRGWGRGACQCHGDFRAFVQIATDRIGDCKLCVHLAHGDKCLAF